MPPPDVDPDSPPTRIGARRLVGTLEYVRRAFALVWDTNRRLGSWLLALSVIGGMLPVAVAYVGKLIVDAVILAAETQGEAERVHVIVLVAVELALVSGLLASYRGLNVCEALLRVQLAQRVTELILEKALTLELADFESAEIYDRLTRARTHAASRPLSLVRTALSSLQEAITLSGFAVLLVRFSPWLVFMLLAAALPAILVEVRFNADAFKLFRAQTPEARRQSYFETVLSREDHAKEVKLFDLGGLLLGKHREIFAQHYAQGRRLTLERGAWGFALAVLGAVALAGSYAWVAWSAIDRRITVGEMAMLFVVLKQAQSIVAVLLMSVASMYEDNLYLSTLAELLGYPVRPWGGRAKTGSKERDGIRFENVSFTYPGRAEPALRDVSFQVPAGSKLAVVGRNGAGKTTLIKLLAGLSEPSSGRILVDGRELHEWDRGALLRMMSVIFQDFARYQLSAGQNIAVGDTTHFDDRERWAEAAHAALAHDDIAALPSGYDTQLGHWFAAGQELSLGQWQRIALARLFMRSSPYILILDEPTACLDRETEAAMFDRLRTFTQDGVMVIVSHRVSAARLADQVLVLDEGRVVDRGHHTELVAKAGLYAELVHASGSSLPPSQTTALLAGQGERTV